jgi:dihydroorotate dehydrogenase electron transfer subunit
MTVEALTTDRYEPGDVIDMFGPIGRQFNYRNTLRNVLLVAYDTPPFPLLMTIPYLLGNSVSVTLVLLGAAAQYPTNLLPPEVEVIRGDDKANPMDWQNQVITIGWADQVFAVVPPGNELAYFERLWQVFNQRRADIGKFYLWGVFQSILPCGVGACDACMIRTQDGYRLPCVEGPALDLHTVFG